VGPNFQKITAVNLVALCCAEICQTCDIQTGIETYDIVITKVSNGTAPFKKMLTVVWIPTFTLT